MTTASGETTTTASTRAFVDAMITHNTHVRAEIDHAAASLAGAGITGPVLDGVHELAGHYADARAHWDTLSTALQQHEALAQQTRATRGAAADMTFYTDDTGKDAMTTPAGSAAPAAGDQGELIDAAGLAPADDDPPAQKAELADLDDVLGFADGQTCLGTDQVHAAAGPATAIALVDAGDGDDSLPFVTVATSTGRWNPLTWEKSEGEGYAAPHLSPEEADQVAQHLDELAEQAEAGYQPAKPTKWGRAAQQLQHLVLADRAARKDKVMVGEDEQFSLSVGDLLTLLQEKDPTASESPRRRVFTQAQDDNGGDVGNVWMDLQAGPDGTTVVVTAVEGNESPDADYWQAYASQLSPGGARELAGKLRRFAAAGRGLGAVDDAAATAVPATDPTRSPVQGQPVPVAVSAQPRRVSNSSGRNFEYDPGTGATAVIESDGWRAMVPPGSPSGIAARLLYWNAEIKDGRGNDATETAARALLNPLSAAELRELADAVGTAARGARTKSQMVDAIITTAISSPRKFRALRQR